jgi:hypothetical protein
VVKGQRSNYLLEIPQINKDLSSAAARRTEKYDRKGRCALSSPATMTAPAMRRVLLLLILVMLNRAGAISSAIPQRHRCLALARARGPRRSSASTTTAAMVSPLSLLKPAAKLYCSSLATAPIVTNCLTAAALSITSDAIAQNFERTSSTKEASGAVCGAKHDYARSAWMGLWGYSIAGLLVHYWFVFLNRLFPAAGLTFVGALKKVTVNQIVMSPLLNSMFFSFTTYTRSDVAGTTRGEYLKRKLAQDLIPTIKRSCAYWGTVQLVNFLYVPQRFTLLYTNFGFLVWTIYISLVGYRQVKE